MKRSIAHITDLHLGEQLPADHGVDANKHWERLLQDVVNRGVQEIMYSGDLGEIESAPWFFETVRQSKLKFDMVLGNHDAFSEMREYYNHPMNQNESELYYSTESQDLSCIYLDSSTGKISQAQLFWLKNQLTSKKRIVLFTHHPVLDCGTILDEQFSLENRTEVFDVLSAHDKSVTIFCGHFHMDDYQTLGNIEQFVTPAGCFQLHKHKTEIQIDNTWFGYRIIQIDGADISSEVIRFKSNEV